MKLEWDKPFFHALLFILFSISCFAQDKVSFKGKVLSQDLEPIQNAEIRFLNTSFYTNTDKEGNFVFYEIPKGSYKLNIQKKGFATVVKLIDLQQPNETEKFLMYSEREKLDEIVVTAQKRENIVQDIPGSITSLSSRIIQERQIYNPNNLTALIPNLFASDPGDRRTITSVRGIVSSSYDPAVATYIDGVNQFNLDTYIPQLFDLERIEVLRGPQGTLYGRNAMGGVINIITKKPGNKTEVFGEAQIGNYGRQRHLGGIRIPLVKDKLFFGMAGLYEKFDGFYTNDFDGSQFDEQQNFSGNYFLTYQFNPTWEATLNFKHYSAKNNGAFPLVFGINEAFENPYHLNQNQTSTMKDQTLNTSLLIEHSGENINFSSQTSFQRNYRYYEDPIDADFSPIDGISIFNNYGKDWNNINVLTQEIQFSSPTDENDKLNWTAGSYMFYQKNPVKQATQFGEDAAFVGSEEINFELINTSEESNKGISFFGQGSYKLTDKINLTAGLRYDIEEKKKSVLGEYKVNSEPQPAFEFQSDTSATASFDSFSPLLGLSYDIDRENMVFFTYKKGFRAGGLTPLTSDPSQPPLFAFKPELSHNFEIGSKNVFFENKVILNAAVFLTKVTDVQVPTLVLPEAVIVTKNTGELTSKGIELEAKILLLKGFEMNYNLGLTEATYNSLKIAGEEGEANFQGNKQIFTPDVTSMLSLQYNSSFKFNKSLQYSLRGQWSYLGEQYFDLSNSLKQDPYSLINAQIGLSYKNWNIGLWGKNILDKRYISYGYNFGAVQLGPPLTYGLSLSFDI